MQVDLDKLGRTQFMVQHQDGKFGHFAVEVRASVVTLPEHCPEASFLLPHPSTCIMCPVHECSSMHADSCSPAARLGTHDSLTQRSQEPSVQVCI